MKGLTTAISALGIFLLAGCRHTYSQSKFSVQEGGSFSTANNGDFRVIRVESRGVTVSSITHPEIRQNWYLDKSKSQGSVALPLGNNERLEILAIDESTRSAVIELSHLRNVSSLEHPPF